MKFYLDKAFSVGAILALGIPGSQASCPYLKNQNSLSQQEERKLNINTRVGDGGVPEGGFAAVQADLEALMVDSQEFWPADYGNYAGFMIRLAWHCSGSYRVSDGRGGCDGGRIRFDPELNWPDNGNLDKALQLLEPIKEKYGPSLSWGDLIVLAGNAALSSTRGPVLGFCGGRIDDPDGANSLILGPSPEQELIGPCVSIGRQGRCEFPLGQTTVGLVYVNPAGPEGATGNTLASGEDIRNSFGRMGFNDTQTVAIVGGGHAYGKAHGACSTPPCGNGMGENTVTSGFEGAWTTIPTVWSNQYFQNMYNFEWTNITGPGGAYQWTPVAPEASITRSAAGSQSVPDIFMLTADLALRDDPAYGPISRSYMEDITVLEHDFMHAWYALTTRDMGPITRCIGDLIPPAQEFQSPLPDAQDEAEPDFVAIRSSIQNLIDEDEVNIAAFSNLAFRCASTYRETDYKGGCNGARIRFPPESEWESNAGTADALVTLQPIMEEYPEISYADLIVLAGQTAVESAGGTGMAFCSGRVDADNAEGSDILAPRVYSPAIVSIRDDMQVKGLTPREWTALAGRPTGTTLSNKFYVNLLANDGDFTPEELALLEAEFREIVEEYADDNDVFLADFADAWTKLMVADRYSGPRENACAGVSTITLPGEIDEATEEAENGEPEEEEEDIEPTEEGVETEGEEEPSSAWMPLSMLHFFVASTAYFTFLNF